MVNHYLNPNALCPKDAESLKIIEENHLGHFAFLPKLLGFDIREINGVTLINCGLKSSMFNIAYGSPKSLKISDSIDEIKNEVTPKNRTIIKETKRVRNVNIFHS